MKSGKLAQTVWRRSVLKQLHTKRSEVLWSPSAEEMCAAWKIPEGHAAVSAWAQSTGQTASVGYYAAAKAVNDLYTRGAAPVGIGLRLLVPPTAEEADVKAVTAQAEALCEELGLQIGQVQAEVSPAVRSMIVSAEAFGSAEKDELLRPEQAKAGQDILLCGSIGLEGILQIAAEREEELGKRFVPAFLHQIQERKKEVLCVETIQAARRAAKSGSCRIAAMQQIGSGGIFGALWELGEAAGVGMQVELGAMTIRQETVEVCEYYQLNPYQMTSGGAVLMIADRGDNLVRMLNEGGARAVKLGVTTAGKARVITSGEEQRYLDRPAGDELIRWQSEQ